MLDILSMFEYQNRMRFGKHFFFVKNVLGYPMINISEHILPEHREYVLDAYLGFYVKFSDIERFERRMHFHEYIELYNYVFINEGYKRTCVLYIVDEGKYSPNLSVFRKSVAEVLYFFQPYLMEEIFE